MAFASCIGEAGQGRCGQVEDRGNRVGGKGQRGACGCNGRPGRDALGRGTFTNAAPHGNTDMPVCTVIQCETFDADAIAARILLRVVVYRAGCYQLLALQVVVRHADRACCRQGVCIAAEGNGDRGCDGASGLPLHAGGDGAVGQGGVTEQGGIEQAADKFDRLRPAHFPVHCQIQRQHAVADSAGLPGDGLQLHVQHAGPLQRRLPTLEIRYGPGTPLPPDVL